MPSTSPLGAPGLYVFALKALVLASCGSADGTRTSPSAEDPSHEALFEVLGPATTGIDFVNDLRESTEFHYFTHRYMYLSGGVAIGDIDGDELPDVFVTSVRNGSRLFKNLGDLRFEDITGTSGIDLAESWATGPSMFDANADGLLDIYVCLAGPSRSFEGLANKLYINQGNGKFLESGSATGTALPSVSEQAYHFDADGDHDLDLLVLAYRTDFENVSLVADYTVLESSNQSHRLLINDGNGVFSDRTPESGFLSHAWGLSASIGDLDNDRRSDVYVAHDFVEPDLVMMNGGDGRFHDKAGEVFRHICFYSMGSDLADINNDGLNDLYVADMTPPDHGRSKQNMASMRPSQFHDMVRYGMHRQYMVNVLQLNNGNGTFSDIAHLAGVDRTDWSWAPLFVDFDQDGWKDLFVSNGIWKDVTNNDMLNELKRIDREKERLTFDRLDQLMPQNFVENVMFRNNGDLSFEKMNEDWGYHHKSSSTGAAYGDLDGDGDMDLVISDVGSTVKVVRNLAVDQGRGHWLQLRLKGLAPNTLAIGSRVNVYSNGTNRISDLYTVRGFQGCVEPLIHVGLGNDGIDSVAIDWYDGTRSVLSGIQVDQRITVDRSSVPTKPQPPRPMERSMWAEQARTIGLEHVHRESVFNDFKDEILLPHSQSDHGPALCTGDVNSDGRDDLFIGSGAGQAAVLFLSTAAGELRQAPDQPWEQIKDQETIGAEFFDADGDGDLDLYTASGSTEFGQESERYQDHLYINQGQGSFTQAQQGSLPRMWVPTDAVASADIDLDGDLDLFVGGRNVPGAYPAPPRSFVLVNDGTGRFEDATERLAPELERIGMVTDAIFHDLNRDGTSDLILCGEWMGIEVFQSTGEGFVRASQQWVPEGLVGWWNDLELADLDKDGDLDLVAGNIGLNNKFHPSPKKPLEIYMDDLDGSGTNDIVLAKHGPGDQCVPVRGKECSSEQMPFINDRFPTYKSFAEASLEGLYGKEQLEKALHYSATHFANMVLRNDGDRFTSMELPNQAQIAPIRGCVAHDVNGDGHVDIVAVGNRWGSEVETTRYDAGNGIVLLGDGQLRFTPMTVQQSGLFASLHANAAAKLIRGSQAFVVVTNIDGPVQVFGPPQEQSLAKR
ncbi:MAG: CRTAC1 family protein [Flavobacteriales bacterium]|nr:CRTAC1 family protein [Flavobacteriales bacterium]